MTHQAHLSHHKYRPDIDGLRAIAVLSVVAFHAFPAQIEGGFIGVDIFFVISGFLISTIIFESLEKGSFSFIEFYSRRIRRIFPALLLVLIACLIFGWFSLLPEELNQLGKHVTAGAVFVSNLILWSETGYFDNSAETKPLLHLWSLGIEEQFYIFWPFLLWAAWKNKINFFLITFLLLIASFSLSIWLIHTNPVETFYSPLTRFWELLCGALLALYTIRKANTSSSNQFFFSLKKLTTDHSQKYSNFLSPSMISFIGFGLLTAGFYLIDKNMKFPGYWALFPVLGSILIILSGPKAWLNRKVLSNKFLYWLGLISFPLYLWHWPLLSFGRIIYFDEPPLKYRYLAIFLSVFLAWLTMKFVERPLRFSTPKSSLRVFSLSSLLLTLAFMGVIISSSNFQDTHSFDKLIVKRKGEHAIGSSLAWYQGKNDWLFLGNSFDNTVAKLKLAIKPDEQKLIEVSEKFSRVSSTANNFGIKTVLILGPNKSSIYPEYLPDEIVSSDTKYSSFYLNKLRELPHLIVYDPTQDLISAKHKGALLYWKTDTHWNNRGAYLAFSGFLKLINLQPPNVSFKQVSTHSGDLIGISKLKDFPLSSLDNWDVIWSDPPSWIEKKIPKEQSTNFGEVTLVNNEKAMSNKYVWVVGDSFAKSLKQYFNATFKEVRYVGHWEQKLKTLPEEISKAERKLDLVVIVKVERSF